MNGDKLATNSYKQALINGLNENETMQLFKLQGLFGTT